jgi:hypothetical protein
LFEFITCCYPLQGAEQLFCYYLQLSLLLSKRPIIQYQLHQPLHSNTTYIFDIEQSHEFGAFVNVGLIHSILNNNNNNIIIQSISTSQIHDQEKYC